MPRALVGSPAGEIFGHLVRMNDGAVHMRLKPGVAARVAALDPARVSEQSARAAQELTEALAPAAHPERLADFAFQLSAYAIAGLLGVERAALPRTAVRVGEFVACLAPGATAETLARGTAAAGELAAQFAALLRRDGLDAVVANTVGYLSQAYEATAGLIGNTLVALAPRRTPGARRGDGLLRGRPRGRAPRLAGAEHAPLPGRGRRRGGPGDAARGSAILVVLAAANRDPAANPDPSAFDPHRRERRALHLRRRRPRCPGETMAIAIAQAGVARLLAAGLEPERLAGGIALPAVGEHARPALRGRHELGRPAVHVAWRSSATP